MRAAHTRRMLGAATVATVTLGGLTACFIPSPPPVPQAPNTDPVVPGTSGAADVREGFIAAGGTTEIELDVADRSAVVLGAASTDGEDLTMRLVGGNADFENDDGASELDDFAFEMRSRDPLIGAVLEPGSYTIELGEYSGDRTGFQLQVLTGSTVVGVGESASLEVAPGAPAVFIARVTTGQESIRAEADFDSVLWGRSSADASSLMDDDSGGDSNPLITLNGTVDGDLVMVAAAYDRDEGGMVLVSVE
ncbi:hypothetical protein ACVWW9_001238 [Agrococcus sp. UYP33]